MSRPARSQPNIAQPDLLVGRQLVAQRISDPEAWGRRVRECVNEHALRLKPAAVALEIGHRTLQRWAAQLGIPQAPTGTHVGDGE